MGLGLKLGLVLGFGQIRIHSSSSTTVSLPVEGFYGFRVQLEVPIALPFTQLGLGLGNLYLFRSERNSFLFLDPNWICSVLGLGFGFVSRGSYLFSDLNGSYFLFPRAVAVVTGRQ